MYKECACFLFLFIVTLTSTMVEFSRRSNLVSFALIGLYF